MTKRLKPKSEFSRNVLTLMTGTTIAQAIPVAISPILTRIYSPEDFGVFALFVAIASIFGSIANARYELAIMLPKKDEDAINIFALGFIINIIICIFLLIIILIFHDYIVKLLNNKEISPWLYFVPLSIFLIGLFNLLNYFNNRMKQYKDLAKANIYKSIVGAIVQLFFGFIKTGVFGLISGQIVSQIVSNTKLFFNIKKLNLFKNIKKSKVVVLAKKYKDFPKFSMWAGLLNNLSRNLTNFLISIFFDVKTLGFYSLTQRILGMPSTLIGSAIGQVYFQEATVEKQQTGKAIKTFNSTVKKLLIIGVPSFGVLFFIVEDLFAFVFGESWRIAGVYAQIIIPFAFVNFIVGSISTVNMVFEKHLYGLYINLTILFVLLITFFIFHTVHFKIFLTYYTFIMTIVYICIWIYYYYVSKGEVE